MHTMLAGFGSGGRILTWLNGAPLPVLAACSRRARYSSNRSISPDMWSPGPVCGASRTTSDTSSTVSPLSTPSLKSCGSGRAWSEPELVLAGLDVYHIIEDPRDPSRIYAAANHAVWGPRVVRSADGGKTWEEPTQSPAFAEGSGEAVKAVWFIRP